MTGGDRQKLIEQMFDVWPMASKQRATWAADIAIAYADRRVAEARKRILELEIRPARGTDIDYNMGISAAIRALSPAREGGSDE